MDVLNIVQLNDLFNIIRTYMIFKLVRTSSGDMFGSLLPNRSLNDGDLTAFRST